MKTSRNKDLLYLEKAKQDLEREKRNIRIAGWILVFVVFWIGTMMILAESYWDKPVSREKTFAVHATYQSCRMGSGGRSGVPGEVLVRFSDLKQQSIKSSPVEELYNAVNTLEPGTKVSLLLHPN